MSWQDMDGAAVVISLRREMERVRNQTVECRRAGIFLEDLPEELRRGRTLVQARKLDATLEHMRGIRLELLGRLLLKESEVVPPSRMEAARSGVSPSEEALAAINMRIEGILAASVRSKPSR